MKKYEYLKILLRCVIRRTEDVNEYSTDGWLQCDACEAGFQHITDTYIISAATKQGGGKQRATAIGVKKVPTVSVTGWGKMYSDIMVDSIYLLLWGDYYDLFLKINIR